VSNQAQYSKPRTQPIDNILEARIDLIFQKTGSQSQTSGFFIWHSIIHQTLFHSLAIFSTYSIIDFEVISQAVLKIFFSIKLESIFCIL
jgi:hypothetical protein